MAGRGSVQDVAARRSSTTGRSTPSAGAGPPRELPAEQEGARTPEPLIVPDVWGEVAGRLDRDAVAAALATLPDAQREALELAYFGGLSQTEIAERTGVPLGTVKSRVRLALVALRRELGLPCPLEAPSREGPP